MPCLAVIYDITGSVSRYVITWEMPHHILCMILLSQIFSSFVFTCLSLKLFFAFLIIQIQQTNELSLTIGVSAFCVFQMKKILKGWVKLFKNLLVQHLIIFDLTLIFFADVFNNLIKQRYLGRQYHLVLPFRHGTFACQSLKKW